MFTYLQQLMVPNYCLYCWVWKFEFRIPIYFTFIDYHHPKCLYVRRVMKYESQMFATIYKGVTLSRKIECLLLRITHVTTVKKIILLNTLRTGKNGRHFADDIFKCILLNQDVWISIKISLKFVPKVPINNIPALIQIMAWRRPGDRP